MVDILVDGYSSVDMNSINGVMRRRPILPRKERELMNTVHQNSCDICTDDAIINGIMRFVM
jgi:hypothetical protein